MTDCTQSSVSENWSSASSSHSPNSRWPRNFGFLSNWPHLVAPWPLGSGQLCWHVVAVFVTLTAIDLAAAVDCWCAKFEYLKYPIQSQSMVSRATSNLIVRLIATINWLTLLFLFHMNCTMAIRYWMVYSAAFSKANSLYFSPLFDIAGLLYFI